MSQSYTAHDNSNQRRLALVAGYHACSFPPPFAADAGLKERFAVVLDSFRADKDGMFFDAELFVQITAALLQAIPHHSLDIEIGANQAPLHSMPALADCYARQEESEREPPLRMKMYSDQRLVACEETEWWVQVGGPAIYHDSYTFSFYTAANRTSDFRSICERVSSEIGAVITGFHEAPSQPPFAPLWKRPLQWLLRG
jgi:hypothetical protein